ncbi:thioesterase domain-containing protein [Hoeflea marina]|uniref:Thioesterase domain-containing protein n=1 Tax=Hoeflea marina TaxID=274592 RepID=A0A317PPW6_9HYPH|nr:acyl carrier protein [Hoeflea marina]PWW03493.1 thioesterase domain-containing protein [Hoeflea marina]
MDTTARIVGIFRDEMRLPAVSADGNFFDLGGDSLMAENIILAVQEAFAVKLQTSVLLKASTPRDLAAVVQGQRHAGDLSRLVTEISGGTEKPAMVMVHGMGGSSLFANRLDDTIRSRARILAMRGMGLGEGEAPLDDADEISGLYLDAARSYAGQTPNIFGGICVGGLIALTMGLKAQTESGKRPQLVLIDPPPLGSLWLKPVKAGRDAKARRGSLDRQVRFWRAVSRVCERFGLGRSVIGRKARRENFKKSLTRAFAGFTPASYPCDVLLVASSQWGETTLADYQKWLGPEASIRTAVMPGQHRDFQRVNRDRINATIREFLGLE